MKKVLKNIIIICIMIMCFSENFIYATTTDTIISGGEGFIGAATTSPMNDTDIKTASDTLYGILMNVGIIVSIVVGVILGIKYMISSAEGQADVKKTLIPYLISCGVLYGSVIIWKMIIKFGNSAF